jgi:hypothetical protein
VQITTNEIGERVVEGKLITADGASLVKAARKLPISTRIFLASQILEEVIQHEEAMDDPWGVAAALRKPSNQVTKVWQAIMNGEM